MKKILLTKGKFALVDNEDFEFLNQWKWSFDNLYAIRGHYLGRINGKDKYRKIYLHREINKTPAGMETDHINQKKLDNRRINLRSVTRFENVRNKKAHKNNKLGIKGIYWHEQLKKYRARITINKKTFNLGYFRNLNNAIFAVKQMEQKYYAI